MHCSFLLALTSAARLLFMSSRIPTTPISPQGPNTCLAFLVTALCLSLHCRITRAKTSSEPRSTASAKGPCRPQIDHVVPAKSDYKASTIVGRWQYDFHLETAVGGVENSVCLHLSIFEAKTIVCANLFSESKAELEYGE